MPIDACSGVGWHAPGGTAACLGAADLCDVCFVFGVSARTDVEIVAAVDATIKAKAKLRVALNIMQKLPIRPMSRSIDKFLMPFLHDIAVKASIA
jgi:hypothetical protein